MPVSKTYTIEFPFVKSAKDYHEFDFLADDLSSFLNEKITFTEIGFDYTYYAAFYPESYIMDNDEVKLLQNKYNLDNE